MLRAPMRFEVQHLSRYQYSLPVALGSHVLRLLPQGPALNLVWRELYIEPWPTSQVIEIDSYDNQVFRVEFAGQTNHLSIRSRFDAYTSAEPPISGSWSLLPWNNPAIASNASDPEVAVFAAEISGRAGGQVIAFLDALSRELFLRTDRQMRPVGSAQTPLETLRMRRGACRDLTLLYMECCQSLGLLARFVSGYQAAADTPDGERHLHAWPEVHLPGVGWRGWDPTHGMRVEGGHVRLCAAPSQLETMPVEGGYTFFGAELTSTLTYEVRIATTA